MQETKNQTVNASSRCNKPKRRTSGGNEKPGRHKKKRNPRQDAGKEEGGDLRPPKCVAVSDVRDGSQRMEKDRQTTG